MTHEKHFILGIKKNLLGGKSYHAILYVMIIDDNPVVLKKGPNEYEGFDF